MPYHETAKPLQSSKFEDNNLGSIYKVYIHNFKSTSMKFKICSLKLFLEWYVDQGDDQEIPVYNCIIVWIPRNTGHLGPFPFTV